LTHSITELGQLQRYGVEGEDSSVAAVRVGDLDGGAGVVHGSCFDIVITFLVYLDNRLVCLCAPEGHGLEVCVKHHQVETVRGELGGTQVGKGSYMSDFFNSDFAIVFLSKLIRQPSINQRVDANISSHATRNQL